MSETTTNRRSFRIREGDIGDAYEFAESLLARKDINTETANETLLVFEALMQRLVDWGLDENTDLEIAGITKLGDFRIRVEFEGRVFAPGDDAADSVEDRILEAHDDKLDYSYHSGCNSISIFVNRSSRTPMVACLIASLCAIALYIPLNSLIDAQGQKDLLDNYVFPLEKLFTNAMLMVGAPMTFFSLLKNLTSTYIVARRTSGVRQLQARTLVTSLIAIVLACASFFVLSIPLSILETNLYGSSSPLVSSIDRTFADVITSFMPPSIFEPFEAASPIPLIAVALLCTYALCSVGKYFDALQQALMACYTLFSRMLRFIVAALPLFCFVSILDVLLDVGVSGIAEFLGFLVATVLPVTLLFATYAIRLHASGIQVIPFARKLTPLLRENVKIGSAIDAAPYNTRYCARNFNMSQAMLRRYLPTLAEINLDGNCVFLMFFALALAFMMEIELSWLSLAGLAMLVFFLSLGAPNQPGSILIGMLIITTYLNAPQMLCIPIYVEAFFGSAQNLINVIGDIIMVATMKSK